MYTISRILVSRQEAGVKRKSGKRRASFVRLDAEFHKVIGTVARAGARPAQIAE